MVPMATASPCRKVPYPVHVSTACPNVCPRFRVARTPLSFSSSSTISALLMHERFIAYASASGSRASTRSQCSSCHAKKAASRMRPYLTTSGRPDTNSRSGRVSRTCVSITTLRGWWKAPIMFLPCGWFTPVLPPTEESTMAITVVGTWMKSTPRW